MLTRRAALAGIGLTAFTPAFAAANDAITAAMAGKAVPGMAALVIRDYRAERELVAGVMRLGSPAPVTRGGRWHLGSDGKAMTATLIAVLVERGVLSWSARLDEMLPQFAASMHPEYRDITLPDLLSHRSGLPENHDDTDFFNSFYDDPASPTEQRRRYIGVALTDAPVVPKRGARSYSNTGPIIAAAAAEQATAQAFETLIVDNVFRPLRIRSISFDQYGGPGEPAGHVDGRVADQPHDANPRMFAPAGAMRMNLRDWSRFCIDHMRGARGQGRLLRAETYRFLHTPQGDTTAALGWGSQASAVGRRGPALTHSGSDGNWYAVVVLFPERGDGVLVAANAAESMGGDAATVAALRTLAATLSEPAEPAPAQ